MWQTFLGNCASFSCDVCHSKPFTNSIPTEKDQAHGHPNTESEGTSSVIQTQGSFCSILRTKSDFARVSPPKHEKWTVGQLQFEGTLERQEPSFEIMCSAPLKR